MNLGCHSCHTLQFIQDALEFTPDCAYADPPAEEDCVLCQTFTPDSDEFIFKTYFTCKCGAEVLLYADNLFDCNDCMKEFDENYLYFAEHKKKASRIDQILVRSNYYTKSALTCQDPDNHDS